jgi:hypothetical protein
VGLSILSLRIFWSIFLIAAAITAGSTSFLAPVLASHHLTKEDRASLEDLLQDKVTICHIPWGIQTKAHDVIVGESVVPDHLAHGDRIGHCSLAKQKPIITVEEPTSCISTENGTISYANVILTGFPFGLVIMTGSDSSYFPLRIEIQSDIHSTPLGFSTGGKNVTAFADTNRNLKQDPGEVSSTKAFTIPCYRS